MRTRVRRIGVHVSISGGLHLSLERAYALGCNTMQIFSHNPRGWAVKGIPQGAASYFKTRRKQLNIAPLYIHTSYLINIASGDRILRKKSLDMLICEMQRADAIGADYVILHTGSAAGYDEQLSRMRAIETLNEIVLSGEWKAGLLLENTAGEKGDIAATIHSLSEILNHVNESFISGICFDTCHAFAAGYDLRDYKGILNISNEIEKYIGIDKVKLFHLNDSKGSLGSHIDRHEHIGIGKIGAKGLQELINFEPFRKIPLILETPKKKETDDPMNLERVRKMIKAKH
ncbi:MAG: deoxyribonuclease IV [Nitrospirae bacterium]|nr:deoxyribonuclease IV [Nitrospirota bacterium]